MMRTPLRLFVLAHPKSEPARRLAQLLMNRFVEPPASGGLRIPTFFTPDRGEDLPPDWEGESAIDLDESVHTLVVVLTDARMMRSVAGGTGDAWKAFFDEGLRRAHVKTSKHYVLGIAVDGGGFALGGAKQVPRIDPPAPQPADGELPDEFAQRLDAWLQVAVEDAALLITIRAIQRLNPQVAPAEGAAPIRLFLSHAKWDLAPDEEDPVRQVENAVKELPIDFWFDAARIRPSHEFADEIKKGILDCSIVVSFQTDHYSSRTWCQREILIAKQAGVPILVVDALKVGEPRSFPYLGNVPTVRWSGVDPKLDARRVVGRAAREALRFMHNRHFVRNALELSEDDDVLAAAPEAVTLTHPRRNSSNTSPYYYPDPPLTTDELDVLKALAPSASFVTPLTKIARTLGDFRPIVATAISSSDELARQGLSTAHELTLSDEIHLYLLMAGCQIAYGGSLEARFDKASNFTLRLFELVSSYAPLAEIVRGIKPMALILNYAPWPLRLGYTEATMNLFNQRADLIEGKRPQSDEVPETDDALFPRQADGRRPFPSDTPEQRLAWAKGLSLMRADMTNAVFARVVIGGRLTGYSGLYPGIVEEAWMSLVTKRPLYLIGAFGGAARAVIETLKTGDANAILSAAEPSDAGECRQIAQSRGMDMIDVGSGFSPDQLDLSGRLILRERIAADIANAGKAGLAAALNNGLNEQENVQVVRATEATMIADLILTGMSRKKP